MIVQENVSLKHLNTFGIDFSVDHYVVVDSLSVLKTLSEEKKLLKNKIKSVISNSSCVIAGNEYIYNYAIKSKAKNIHIIPTVIDFNKYKNISKKSTEIFKIGWIGSPSTVKYLDIVKPVLVKLLNFINPTSRDLLIIETL